jgi:hypothetical protein
VLRFAVEFGMTALARTRISVGPNARHGKFSGPLR